MQETDSIKENEFSAESLPDEKVLPVRDEETNPENNKWEKTHPLNKKQLQLFAGIVVLILSAIAVLLFYAFQEMFEAQKPLEQQEPQEQRQEHQIK